MHVSNQEILLRLLVPLGLSGTVGLQRAFSGNLAGIMIDTQPP
jgi:hypothetical protein